MARDGRHQWRGVVTRGGLVLLGAVVAVSLALGQSQRNSEAALQAVRKQIKEVEMQLARETSRRDAGAKALRATELDIAAATRKLAAIRADLAGQRTTERGLDDQTKRANQRLGIEREALARQVRLSYMTGREELFKLLLSQESPADLGRMLAYYDYYNRARIARIEAVGAEVLQLQRLGAQTARVKENLAALEAAQAAQVGALGRSRDERQTAVASLDASIKDAGAAVAKLRAEERRLAELVVQLGELMAGLPVDADRPFSSLKGKLSWPVQGRLTGDFGQPRGDGPVKWTGVLLETAAGTPVRAVYYGRVAFADWLAGLGLLLIIDHGGGYMSLYGHNEALLKESGDWVEPGEVIAQVGDTGGQARAGLYFEIRYKGEPVDPHPWIGRRPR